MRRISFCLMAACLLIPAAAGSNPAFAVSAIDDSAALQKSFADLFSRSGLPNLAVAVIEDGAIHWTAGFGTREAGKELPVDGHTIFEAASLSKPVFAYAVLKLVERGTLDLDTPLLKYIDQASLENSFLKAPMRDERFRKITTRLVLMHATGFPNWRFFRGRDAALEFDADPGARFGYSGEGFVMLQKTVEHLTGKSLDDLARELVFLPLGMADSSYIYRGDWDDHISSRHNAAGAATGVNAQTDANAAASLRTSAHDYALFLAALINGSGLSEATQAEMFRPQIVADRNSNGAVCWGLGIGLELDADGSYLWHWGDNGDSKAFFFASRAQKRGFVYFSSSTYGLSVVDAATRLVFPGTHPVLDSSFLDDYIRFDAPAMKLVTVYNAQGVDAALRLYAELTGPDGRNPGALPETVLNSIGYDLLRQQKFVEAIRVFRLNMDAWPQSANCCDSLAEAYLNAGDQEKAIEFYRKALSIDPEFTSSKTALERLLKAK